MLTISVNSLLNQGNNFNSVLAKSGAFLPVNDNLTRELETKKQISAIHPIKDPR